MGSSRMATDAPVAAARGKFMPKGQGRRQSTPRSGPESRPSRPGHGHAGCKDTSEEQASTATLAVVTTALLRACAPPRPWQVLGVNDGAVDQPRADLV